MYHPSAASCPSQPLPHALQSARTASGIMRTAGLNGHDTEALLSFYAAAGLDVAVGEEPRNRFGEAAPARATPVAGAGAPSPADAPVMAAMPLVTAPDEAIGSARELAARAQSLDELRALLEGFDGCALKATATQLVFSDGNPEARLMLIGEAPGRDEDREGKPFVGRSGQLLDKMLGAIGIDRSTAYIANVVPWRPPGNRTPTPQETQVCLPFIRRQIVLSGAEIVLFLGAAAAQAILGTSEGILRLRGRWHDLEIDGRHVRAMATLHPAFLLRSPLQKRLAWRDFRAVRAALDTPKDR